MSCSLGHSTEATPDAGTRVRIASMQGSIGPPMEQSKPTSRLSRIPAATASLRRLHTARFQPSFVEICAAARMFVAPSSRMRERTVVQSP